MLLYDCIGYKVLYLDVARTDTDLQEQLMVDYGALEIQTKDALAAASARITENAYDSFVNYNAKNIIEVGVRSMLKELKLESMILDKASKEVIINKAVRNRIAVLLDKLDISVIDATHDTGSSIDMVKYSKESMLTALTDNTLNVPSNMANSISKLMNSVTQ